jgi:hypothetical protein
MSNNHGHTYNLNERREREKTTDALGNFHLKPLSSPRNNLNANASILVEKITASNNTSVEPQKNTSNLLI